MAASRAEEATPLKSAASANGIGDDATPVEDELLSANAKKFAAWRDCRLRAAVVPTFLGLVLQGYSFFGNRYNAADHASMAFGKEYAQYFSVMIMLGKVESFCAFAFGVGSFLALVMAVGTWLSRGSGKHSSVVRVRWAVGLGFAGPFLLMLFIPYHLGLDSAGLRKATCLDFVREVRSRLRSHMAVDVIDRIYTMNNITLHEDICHVGGAEHWETTVISQLRSSTMFSVNETCGTRVTFLEEASAVTFEKMSEPALAADLAKDVLMGCTAQCPDQSSEVCESSCTPLFAPLGLVVALKGPSALLNDNFEMLGEVGTKCGPCLKDIVMCLADCSGIKDFFSKQKFCVREDELAALKMLMMIFSSANIVGFAFGCRAVILLIPFASSVIHGVTVGSKNAGKVLPSSAFPIFLGLAGSLCSIPLMLIGLIFVNSILGNLLLEVGILLYIFDRVLSTRFWLTTDVSEPVQDCLASKKVQWAEFILTIVFLGSGIFWSLWHISSGEVFAAIGEYIATYHWERILELVLQGFAASYVFRLIFAFVGSSLLFSVFFADTFVSLTYSFHHQSLSMPQEQHNMLWQDMECLRRIIDGDNEGWTRTIAVDPPEGKAKAASSPKASSSFFLCCSNWATSRPAEVRTGPPAPEGPRLAKP